MRIEQFKSFGLEIAAGAVCLAGAAAGIVQVASQPVEAVGALAAFSAAALGGGVACGSFARAVRDRAAFSERDRTLAELGRRPTAEAHESALARAREAEGALASARAELSSLSEELHESERACRSLAGALERARVTMELDRFSDFQLLGMCDVCDAEGSQGYLLRAYGDPAMDQLLALGVVSFDASQDGSKDLKWTLRPEWRQTLRAHRDEVDARTRMLRQRRDGEVDTIV